MSLISHKKHMEIPITFFIIVLLNVLILVFNDSITATLQSQREESYGSWQGAVFNVDDDLIKLLSENVMVESVGYMSIEGDVLDKSGSVIGSIGYTNENLITIGKLELLDGRFPQEADEIALETSILDSLGLSYELGQIINLNVLSEDSLNTKEEIKSFTLCGVVKNYSNNWKNNSYPLISGFIYPESVDKTPKMQHIFIKTYEQYISYVKDLNALCDNRLTLNDYTYLVYAEQDADNLNINILNITVFLTGFAIIILLVNNEIIKRQSDFITLRTLGATKGTIIGMFFNEKIILFVIVIVIGTVFGLIISYALFKVLVFEGKNVVFAIKNIHIIQSIIMNIGGISVALLFGFVRIFQLPMRGKSDQQGRHAVKRSSKKLNAKNIFSCFNNADRANRILSYFLSVSAITLIFITTYQTWKQYSDYRKYVHDYPIDYSFGLFATYNRPMRQCTLDEVDKIRGAYGVSDIQSYSVSSYHKISFDRGYDEKYAYIVGNELKRYFKKSNKDQYPDSEEVCGVLTGISDNLCSIYLPFAEMEPEKKELLENDIILYLPDYFLFDDGTTIASDMWVGDNGKNQNIISEEHIRIGDSITFFSDGKSYVLNVSGIIRNQKGLPFCYYMVRPYSILCNQETYKKICGENDYVYLLIKRDDKAIAYQTDAELSKAKTPLYFTNNRTEKDTYVTNICIQMIMTMIVSIAVVIMIILAGYSIQSMTNGYEIYRYKTLYQLGMTQKRIRKELFKGNIKDSIVSCILALLIEIVWLFIGRSLSYKSMEYKPDSNLQQIIQICKELIKDNHWGFIVIMLILAFVSTLTVLSIKSRKIIKQI